MTFAIRAARPDDYEALCALFDELDEFHRRGRSDFFCSFDGPARPREVVEPWRSGHGSAALVAEDGEVVIGLAVLLRRLRSGFAGAVRRKVIELDTFWCGAIGGAGAGGLKRPISAS